MRCRAVCGSGGVHCRALVRAACGGDGSACDPLARLVEQAWPEVHSLVRRSGARSCDVDDLTQSYFARFVEKDTVRRLETWDGCLRPFLLTSVRNFLSNARDRSRALKRGGRRRTLSLEGIGAFAPPLPALVCATTPESLLESAERQHALRRAIETVVAEARDAQEGCRVATLLSRLAGDAVDADIATRWGTSPGAVRVAAHRLRRRLSRALTSALAPASRPWREEGHRLPR